MQLAATGTAPTSAPAPEIRNVHLTSMIATDDPRVTNLRTLFVAYDVTPTALYGGTVSSSRWVDGRTTGIGMRAYLQSQAEREAAGAVLDAIRASGLLTAQLPPLDWKHPEVGRTRLYLDRRSRFLEFDTANPPAVVQAILGALSTYEQVARGGGSVVA